MLLSEFIYKAQRKLYTRLYFNRIVCKPFVEYCSHYASYRYSLRHEAAPQYVNYLGARPNPGAGIGHQLANWMAGYHLAQRFGLKFAHIPFSGQHHPFRPNEWEALLGFGEGEAVYKNLLMGGVKRVLLPRFNVSNEDEVAVIRRIIASYADEPVVFLCEQDQFYRDLHTLIPQLQHKFYAAPARSADRLIFDSSHYNIAIHVRRGDIMADPSNPNLAMRYLSNDYYEKVLRQALRRIHTDKPVHIYFFSQGQPADYPEFAKYANLHWCMEMSATLSFLHMVYADLLITSKSSFSYKPALLNRGLKISPRYFWHGYPDSPDWLLADNEGTIL